MFLPFSLAHQLPLSIPLSLSLTYFPHSLSSTLLGSLITLRFYFTSSPCPSTIQHFLCFSHFPFRKDYMFRVWWVFVIDVYTPPSHFLLKRPLWNKQKCPTPENPLLAHPCCNQMHATACQPQSLHTHSRCCNRSHKQEYVMSLAVKHSNIVNHLYFVMHGYVLILIWFFFFTGEH